MKWLHISDIHFNFKGYDSNNVKNKLVEKLEEMNIAVDFIIITGDIMYQYNSDAKNRNELVKYINLIAKKCKCNHNNIYLCPGNHDVSRSDENRNDIIKKIREEKLGFSEKCHELCEMGHEKFFDIYKAIKKRDYEAYKVFDHKKQNYRIISLDTSLTSKDKNDFEQLHICSEKLLKISSKIINDDKLNVLIMHHGIECLKKDEARKLEQWIEDNNIDIVHCGHTHRAAITTYDDCFRDIKQFTAGAIIIDNYAVPSFYLCEYNKSDAAINISLYTYSSKVENWHKDNQSLRKFTTGAFEYKLNRHIIRTQNLNEKKDVVKYKDNYIISDLNQKYSKHYGNSKIYSNKYDGYEDFDAWRIVRSLAEIGIPYEKAFEITIRVINTITSESHKRINEFISSLELRETIYETIINYTPSSKEYGYDVSIWASRYARKYNRNSEIMVLCSEKNKEKLNYSYIKNVLIKEIFDKVTNDSTFYDKIFRNELSRMAESILAFLKNMGIFEIRKNALHELIEEYITQKPHPWLIRNNRKEISIYHQEQALKHIEAIRNKDRSIISQIEAAYHICASFLSQYDDYIGCTEISPIIILTKTVNCMDNIDQTTINRLPIKKYQIIQLKKDLEKRGIRFIEFKNSLNIIYNNIVNAKIVTNEETANALVNLWNILINLNQALPKFSDSSLGSLEKFIKIFDDAKGFIVKSPLRALPTCFWVEPNWEEHEVSQNHLNKQMLVCLMDDLSIIDEIYSYIYEHDVHRNLSEIVFAFKDRTSFNSDDRKTVRERFKRRGIRCIFIQPNNYDELSEGKDWRNILYGIICISRIS